MRSRSVTSAVRICPSTIMRRAATVSNMYRVQFAEPRCAARSRKTQVRQGYFTGREPAAGGCGEKLRPPGLALPRGCFLYGGISSIERDDLAAGFGRYAIPDGHVAEWLRNGLQNRVPRFNSGRGLHFTLLAIDGCTLPDG